MFDPQHWLLLTEDVREVANQAARRIHYRYSEQVDLEDLTQEALIALVSIPDLVGLLSNDDVELGLIQYRLEQALTRRYRTEVARKALEANYEGYVNEEDDDGITGLDYLSPTYVPLPPITQDYNRETVELLLPAVWDETLCYGLANERAADPDMPRGSTNKATGNNLPAFIADIKTGWAKSPLTYRERRAVLMHYGLGWEQTTIAAHEGVTKAVISTRLATAIGKIVARLNGGMHYDPLGAF